MQIQHLREYQKNRHPMLSLECDTPLDEAIRQMNLHDYGSVICTQGGRYHGMFTARLLLKHMTSVNDNIGGLLLRDVVRTNGPVAQLDDDAATKLEEMNRAHVHYMPILDEKGHCVGMLSQGDFAAYTLEQAGVRFAEALKNKAEDHTNPPSMVIAMAIYAIVALTAIGIIFY